jgi:hypothetical protein
MIYILYGMYWCMALYDVLAIADYIKFKLDIKYGDEMKRQLILCINADYTTKMGA